jgi:HD-GYP domain-containing protein (c-di-GMP phosphodiesterase class II)
VNNRAIQSLRSLMKAQDLSKKIMQIPAERLRPGLYVSRLDRPWTDTPFLFQGFTIESDEQIQQLRDLCKVVYVEVSRTEADELDAAALSAKAGNATFALASSDLIAELSSNPTALIERVPAKDTIALKTELTLATETFTDAKRAVGNIFENLRRGGGLDVPQLETVVGSMVESVFRNRDAMSWLARMKNTDDYLYSHSLAASVWAMAFGRHLGLDKDTLKALGTGAMLLDVGKTRLPAELLKRSSKPTEAEWALIRGHVEHGVELVRASANVDSRVLSMIATHHERLDGSGYPNGLSGEEIPLVGRIGGIIDSYDAMIADRPYSRPKSPYDAVRELKRLADVAFPAALVELFIQAVGVFPTGTLVELNTGEVGVVTGQNRFRRLRPEVMLILDANKKLREEFVTLDLLTCGQNAGRKEPTVWIKGGLERGAYGIDPAEYFL